VDADAVSWSLSNPNLKDPNHTPTPKKQLITNPPQHQAPLDPKHPPHLLPVAMITSDRVATATSGSISGTGLAHANTTGSRAIVNSISGVSRLPAERPRKTSAPSTACVMRWLMVGDEGGGDEGGGDEGGGGVG